MFGEGFHTITNYLGADTVISTPYPVLYFLTASVEACNTFVELLTTN